MALLFKNLVRSPTTRVLAAGDGVLHKFRERCQNLPTCCSLNCQGHTLMTSHTTTENVGGMVAAIHTTREFHEKFHADGELTGAIVAGGDSRSFELGQWNNHLPSRHHMATEMEISSKVIALADFVGDPDRSPFWDIVATSSSDPQVFESKLLQLAVQFKWQRVESLARSALILFIVHFVLMCATLIYDTQDHLERNACPATSETCGNQRFGPVVMMAWTAACITLPDVPSSTSRRS